MATKNEEITPEVSKRMCAHMNDDHGVAVYAMAKSKISLSGRNCKLTDAKMKKVTLQGCEIQAITCSGDLCEMQRIVYPFDPPLTSSQEARSRFVSIHHQVCAPRVSWLVTKPLALIIAITCLCLGYGTLVVGVENLTAFIEDAKMLNQYISMVFGSARIFSEIVRVAFWFSVIAHDLETCYAIYHCRTTLKLTWNPTLLWAFTIGLVGYPIFNEFLALVSVSRIMKGQTKSH